MSRSVVYCSVGEVFFEESLGYFHGVFAVGIGDLSLAVGEFLFPCEAVLCVGFLVELSSFGHGLYGGFEESLPSGQVEASHESCPCALRIVVEGG